MKTFRIIFAVTLFLTLLTTGVAYAEPDEPQIPDAPETISIFTITPSSAYTGDIVTFDISFTVAPSDLANPNVLCLYYNVSAFTAPLSAFDTLTSIDLGDVYTQEEGSGIGTGTLHCPGSAGRYVMGWFNNDPNDDAEFGDSVSLSFPVPTGATTVNFTLRQRNGSASVGGSNKTLTILTVGATVYVANDIATCGSNSPCRIGQTALDWAFDNVSTGGTVIFLGAYTMSPSASATLTDGKTITLTGQSGASLNNAAGVCSSNAMVEVNHATANLSVVNLTIDGSCSTSNRSAGILNTNGVTTVKTGTTTIRDFLGANNAAVEITGGTMVVENNTFANNQAAMEQSGGTLYAFANNITTNTGANAAISTGGIYNVRCNYWGNASISGFGTDYSERLGATVASYVEGTGPLTLGNATLASGTGSQVLLNLGRSTSNPPFNNGTTTGLGALVSDFFATCLSRDGSAIGAITITGDSVTPGPDGFGLFEITDVTACSPSTNPLCWNYENVSCQVIGCSLTDPFPSEGHFVLGNELDPTVLQLKSLTATTPQFMWLPTALAGLLLMSGSLFLFRRKIQ